jgi:HEAT repeat protein
MTRQKDIMDVVNQFTPESQPSKGWFKYAAAAFRKLQIKSIKDLMSHYMTLPVKGRFVALFLFMKYRHRGALPIIFKELSGNNSVLAGIAAGAVATIGGDDVLNRIVRLLRRQTPDLRRMPLVSALSMLRKIQDIELWTRHLLAILKDKSEPLECRMSAAEGAANALMAADKRSRLYLNAISVLMAMLVDDSPDVRACSAFALGQLRSKKSIKKLEQLVRDDQARCCLHAGHPGGWTVSMEAKEAIEAIKG